MNVIPANIYIETTGTGPNLVLLHGWGMSGAVWQPIVKRLSKYFTHLRSTFTSVRALVGYRSLVVQLVGFSKPELQLPLYLTKMKEAGFEELMPQCDRSALYHGRIWRNVPSRRWYASIDPRTNSSTEVLLLHRPIY